MSTEKRGGGRESEREAREREREGRMDDREKWVIVYVIVCELGTWQDQHHDSSLLLI
jgi:hypothetical protein